MRRLMTWLHADSPPEVFWVLFGFAAQLMFTGRFQFNGWPRKSKGNVGWFRWHSGISRSSAG